MNQNQKYSKELINRFLNPKNMGEIKNPDSVAEVINPICKDSTKIYFKIKEKKIKSIRFKSFGCCAAIASSDVVCELACGKTLEKAKKITEKNIINHLGEIPESKIHCVKLALTALKKAIKNYQKI